jgi:hypothetical protein
MRYNVSFRETWLVAFGVSRPPPGEVIAVEHRSRR